MPKNLLECGLKMNKEDKLARKVRLKIKSMYVNKKQGKECYVTGKKDNLEVHHLYPIASIVRDWEKTLTEDLTDDEKLAKIEKELPELFTEDNLIILCKEEHKLLHEIFGRTYARKQIPKVKEWLEKRRLKLNANSKSKV